MVVRAGGGLAWAQVAFALAALAAAAATHAHTASPSIDVDVVTTTEQPDEEDLPYTNELINELKSAKADSLLLYTVFTAKSSRSLKQLIRTLSRLEQIIKVQLEPSLLDEAPEECKIVFQKKLKKIRLDAHRAALFSGENHHKFFLGHMIVFRMHLNKSEGYIKKCDKIVSKCGMKCESVPKIKRWRKLAAEELSRVRDDLQHSRKMYRDLLAHVQKRLNNLRQQVDGSAKDAVEDLRLCASNSNLYAT